MITDLIEIPDEEAMMRKPRITKVKNKMPALVQITAEQLLREAKERELEVTPQAPTQRITNIAELKDFQLRKRKDYEENVRKNRLAMQNWIKYAKFEEAQGELQRARSVFERALDVEFKNIGVWLKYGEMEMRNKQVNHARNLWDRAVTLMPRVNQFWYKYTHMEEILQNIAGARMIFERWMEWQPEEQAWHAFINFELRYKEIDRARLVYERFVLVHPEGKNWIKYAKFEEKNNFYASARKVYERSIAFFGTDNPQARLLIEFAKFEERQKEHERARVIYKYALDNLPKDECEEIYKAYTLHEKKYGDRLAIEDVILNKRKFQYEEEVAKNPLNYDIWFDYIRLMEEESDTLQTREIYERAVANLPPLQEKRYWRRYIYLWINYALYEELTAMDTERARQVYQFCLKLIPHKKFTFAKIWLYAAKFEIRQKCLFEARKLLGNAIGICPKDKLFRGYIELEIQLREFDRCRKLYGKFIEYCPENCNTWMRFAEMETLLGETDRARCIYDLALEQELLDMPELLWKAYIDFEIEQREWDRARGLYKRLMGISQHVKIWISLANFELCAQDVIAPEAAENPEDEKKIEIHNENEAVKAIERARQVYKDANETLKTNEDKEQRVKLIQSWKEFEIEYGDAETLDSVVKIEPRRIVRTKRRAESDENMGGASGWEEYVEYVFPDDENNQPNKKLLAMASKWLENTKGTGGLFVPSEDEDSDNDENDGSGEDEPGPSRSSKRSQDSFGEREIKRSKVQEDNLDADDDFVAQEQTDEENNLSEDEISNDTKDNVKIISSKQKINQKALDEFRSQNKIPEENPDEIKLPDEFYD